MKTKFKYIHFKHDPKDNTWECLNTKHRQVLGGVWYYNLWKKWVFVSEPAAVFSADCLRDIAEFMEQLKK